MLNVIRNIFIPIFFSLIINLNFALADLDELKRQCRGDLDFLHKNLIENSAPYRNKSDKYFHEMLKGGYEYSKELVDHIGDKDDCYQALKYFINGFDDRSINIRPNFKLPSKKYPGFLTVKENGVHKVVYKHPGVSYLAQMNLGDEVVKINNMNIEEYSEDFIKYFYDLNESEYSTKAASIHTFIEDGNKFVPTPRSAMFRNNNGREYSLELKYADISHNALKLFLRTKYGNYHDFKVDIFNNNAWISIPTFYPDQKQEVILRGILTSLKKMRKLDSIIFDMRGNVGGKAEIQRAIIRNLYGDEYLKSLGEQYEFNKPMIVKHCASKLVLEEFKANHNKAEISFFSKALHKGEDFYEEKRDLYEEENEYLFSNKENDPVTAKVAILTDNFCGGSCWMFVRQMRQIPGVVHLGATTDVETHYYHSMTLHTPSNMFDFMIPTRMKIRPADNFGKSFIPHKVYNDDFYNNHKVMEWVLSNIQ